MVTTVTQNNGVTIPDEVRRKLGIKRGWRPEWNLVEGRAEILIRVIPDRGEMASRLIGAGRRFSPARDSVAEVVAERSSGGLRPCASCSTPLPSLPGSGEPAGREVGIYRVPGTTTSKSSVTIRSKCSRLNVSIRWAPPFWAQARIRAS